MVIGLDEGDAQDRGHEAEVGGAICAAVRPATRLGHGALEEVDRQDPASMIIGIPKSVACLPVSPALAFIRSRLASLAAAALRLTLRPSTSPVQPLLFASATRSLRLAMISVNRLFAVEGVEVIGASLPG